MKYLVIDFQGINTPAFSVKELAVFDGNQLCHYVFKPPKPLSSIMDSSLLSQIKYLRRNHHCLDYNDGDISYSKLETILDHHIQGVDRVYVKGAVKMQFLKEALDTLPEVINVEYMEECPKLTKEIPACSYHDVNVHNPKCICAINNCKKLYYWITNFLPNK